MSIFKNLSIMSVLLISFDAVASDGEMVAEESEASERQYCSLKVEPPRYFSPEVDSDRASVLIVTRNKWVNGTKLRYYFFDKNSDGEYVTVRGGQFWVPWKGSENDKTVVRDAFKEWKSIGIGLSFEEVSDRRDADIRIGFMQGDGAWSYVGRGILGRGSNNRTMNFGWMDPDTALHEIGHTLGFPHSHQNPKAGIVWNEEQVYKDLAKPPNKWSREKTYYNIIRKLDIREVEGSNWDANSIMHYPFDEGQILKPEEYKGGLIPKPGLSEKDIEWAQRFYPALEEESVPLLKVDTNVSLDLSNGETRNYKIIPKHTGEYQIETFGTLDTVMVLFDSQQRKLASDDDSGHDYNARVSSVLLKDAEYQLGVRLYYTSDVGNVGLKMTQIN